MATKGDVGPSNTDDRIPYCHANTDNRHYRLLNKVLLVESMRSMMSTPRSVVGASAILVVWLRIGLVAFAEEAPAALVLGKVQAITGEENNASPAQVLSQLQDLLKEHPRDAILLWASAEAACRQEKTQEMVQALVELPDDSPDFEWAMSQVLASWRHLGDLTLIARTVVRECEFIRAGHPLRVGSDRPRMLRRLVSLEKSLAWRGNADVPADVQEIIRAIRDLRQALKEDERTVTGTAGPEAWWPKAAPLNAEGWKSVIDQQTARAEEENQKGPTFEQELKRVREIQSETRYQVELEKLNSMRKTGQFRNGRLTGPEWETLTRLTKVGPQIKRLCDESYSPADWKIGMRIWSDVIDESPGFGAVHPSIWSAFSSQFAPNLLNLRLQKELERRKLPDTVDM
jgi:hypothetical protein